MRRAFPRVLLAVLATLSLWHSARVVAESQTALAPPQESSRPEYSRPKYNLHLNLDYALLTFSADGTIFIPVKNGDAISDASFFIYANAPGVSGNDESHSNIVVDEVLLGTQKLEYSLKGAVLKVKLPQPQAHTFDLKIKWRGVVPRSPAGSGGLMDAMGGMDLGALLGNGLGGAPSTEKKKEPDYGVYSYGNGVLSLGSFWYPSLAVRQNGKWMDEAPSGVGDVGFSEASDFEVLIEPNELSQNIVSSGGMPYYSKKIQYNFPTDENEKGSDKPFDIRIPLFNRTKGSFLRQATNSRDFSVLISKDFVTKSREIDAVENPGLYFPTKPITVSVYLTKAHEAKADKVLDIATRALEIYSKKFGAYPYKEFKVVEGPMRGGAGGMEFSGMVSIASFLFEDMDKQMQQLAGGLGVGDIGKTLGDLGLDEDGAKAADGKAENPATDMLGGMLGQQKQIFDSLLEMTIAHEVAHQWWAMGVGSDAQRAPWQDESLTNYSSMIYFEDRYGKAKMQEMMDLHLKTSYSMGRMLGSPDARVDLATNQYASSMQYGAIVYGKGALFYDALRTLVGDEIFFSSLRAYFQKYNGQLAPRNSLIEIIKAKAPQKKTEIGNLFARWIESTHGDEDIAGGKVAGVDELLGGLLGGVMPGGAGDE